MLSSQYHELLVKLEGLAKYVDKVEQADMKRQVKQLKADINELEGGWAI